MKQEERDLLLKDLCARLPHGVKVECILIFANDLEVLDSKAIIRFIPKEFAIDTHGIVEYLEDNDEFDKDTQEVIQDYLDMKVVTIDNLIPYLRPMSSMTEEEFEQWERYMIPTNIHNIEGNLKGAILLDDFDSALDWLNSHHFDYRGLIEKGLALEAPEGMYNLNKE